MDQKPVDRPAQLPMLLLVCAAVALTVVVAASRAVMSRQTSPSVVSPCSASTGSISAQINGVRWVSNCVYVDRSTNALLILGADTDDPARAQSNQTLFFNVVQSPGAIGTPLQPGTYQLGGTSTSCSSANLQIGCDVPGRRTCVGWAVGACYFSTARSAEGTVTITTLTVAGASGAFSFAMAPNPDTQASGMKAVTNGVFDVRF